MRNGNPLRLAACLAAGALLTGCGPSAPDAADMQNAGAEVTVVLPPAQPSETAAAEPKSTPPAAKTAPSAQAKGGGLVAAPPPIAMSSLARYIRGAGFACDDVVSSTQLERDGARVGIYKFECGSGESYQGTMRQNHLYFREWRGVPTG